MATGDLIKLGTLYMGSTKVPRPTRPWRNSGEPYEGAGVGNILSYSIGAALEIRNTESNDADKMQWIEVNEGGKKYLVCDRVMLVNISWGDLNAQNLIFGKTITIDGQQYRVRSLTVGSNYRTGIDTYSGGTPSSNEWDRWIVNEAGLNDLPIPTASDLGSTLDSSDLYSVHNRKWNWMGVYSWGQETYTGESSNRAVRGYSSARYWYYYTSSTNRTAYHGWRPVLEVLNSPPTITPSPLPSGTYTTKPSFNYTVTDPDGNMMTITEKIDGVVFNTRSNVSSGTTLNYVPTDLVWLRTRINQTVNITITADDGNGGVTTVNYPITRTTPAIDLQLKTPFTTDVAARRLLLQLEGNLPNDAIVSVQACNNAFDASPTWENATSLVLSGFPYPFNNKVKTAAKWGVSFKLRIERGGSTQPIYIDGLGGAFD